MLHWIMTRGCRNRLFEWVTSIAMTWLGVRLVMNPQVISHSTFRMILEVMSPLAMAWLFVLVGLLRVSALSADGYRGHSWTPVLRSFGSLMAAVIWVQMAIALEAALNAGTTTIGAPIYFTLTLGELFSCYRALARTGNGN